MPTRPPRPCLTCQTLTTAGSHCPDCYRTRQRARNKARGDRYDTAYRNARRTLLATNPPCHWCGAPATTADHIGDTLDDGLVPACLSCNSRRVRPQRGKGPRIFKVPRILYPPLAMFLAPRVRGEHLN